MDRWHTYEYVFDRNELQIRACVVHKFESISDLEDISNFPHRERREFATKLLDKFCAGIHHKLDDTDITCPFAQQLNILFEGDLKIYWSRKQRIITLLYTK